MRRKAIANRGVKLSRSYLLRLMPIDDPASLEKLLEGFRNTGLPV